MVDRAESGERPETLGAERVNVRETALRILHEAEARRAAAAEADARLSECGECAELRAALGQAEAERDEARELFDRSNRLATKAALEAGNDVRVWRERAAAAEAALAGARREALEDAATIAMTWAAARREAGAAADNAKNHDGAFHCYLKAVQLEEFAAAICALAGSAGTETDNA